MELKLIHLAPYLPYGLKVQYIGSLDDENKRIESGYIKIGEIADIGNIEIRYQSPIIWMDFKRGYFGISIDQIKPILRPLSDLTKEIEHNGDKFIPLIRINNELQYDWKFDIKDNCFIDFGLDYKNRFDTAELPFDVIQKFCEWHIDIFGLIPEGLAIDFNTINP